MNSIDLQLIKLALEEDLGTPYCDATTELLFPESKVSVAHIVSKHPTEIIFCGGALVEAIFEEFQKQSVVPANAGMTIEAPKITNHYKDGDLIPPGATILTLSAPANHLVMLERTILNFLRHLSGIATLTAEFMQKIKHTNCKLLDTRKTTPGWRHLEKYAVLCGGGLNHRQGLYDAIMIKDTHVDLLGGMKQTLENLPTEKKLPVIVEVRDIKELETTLLFKNKIDRILLDNIRGDLLKECIAICHSENVLTEASGNLTLDNILEVAESGVDFASVGALTHSAQQIDLSMKTK
jgi:nicotinate-nucleotide pyrophosphorylase (carboxylating)